MGIEGFVVFFLVTALFSAAVAVVALRRRPDTAARPAGWMLLAVALWSFASAFEYAASTLAEKLVWAKIEYIGIETAPVFLLLFALEYNRLQYLMTRVRIALLFAIPVTVIVLAWTNEFHRLVWSGFSPPLASR